MAVVRCPKTGKSYVQDKCEWHEAPRVEVLTTKAVGTTDRFTVPSEKLQHRRDEICK
jgi:hypothetical protein